MKQLVRNFATYLLRHLFGPVGRSEIIRASISPKNHLQNMRGIDRHTYKFESARLSGETYSCALGDNGCFIGYVDDACVFERYATERQWAPSLIKFIKRIHSNGQGTYIDIGANIGLTVIPVARHCGVPCIAVEAEPGNFRLLKANVALNDVDNLIRPIHFAAYSHSTKIEIELSDHNFGDHHIKPPNSPNAVPEIRATKTYTVDAKPLDEVIFPETLSTPITIKIDTQGSEPFVLAGATQLLRRTDLLVLEIDPKLLARLDLSLRDLFDQIRPAEFSHAFWSTFDNTESRPTSGIKDANEALDDVDMYFAKGGSQYLDLVLFRESLDVPDAWIEH